MINKYRIEAFKKSQEVEDILELLENHLSSVEIDLTESSNSSDYPTIFIFGSARSGTTVLHQYLIKNLECIYPSNFISRFYYAPYIGGLYLKLFTKLDKRGELLGNLTKKTKSFFSSDLGKTEGTLSPNEFWYFWRKNFPINDKGNIDSEIIDPEKARIFRNSIYALQNLFSSPFISKGMIANNCISMLEELIPGSIFIFIKRDLFSNARSLYQARINFFNDPKKWYSFYPKDPHYYKNMTPEEQVVHQVLDTNRQIEASLNKCNAERVICTDYKTFCDKPHRVIEQLTGVDRSIKSKKELSPSSFTYRDRNEIKSKVGERLLYIINSLEDK